MCAQVNTVIFEENAFGSTVDALTSILDLDARMLKQVTFVIKNTGAASLTLRVVSYNKKGGSIGTTEVNDTTITAGSTLRYFSSKYVAQLIFSVRSTGAGAPTTYSIEYTTSK